MSVTTMSSRDFNQDTGRAKAAARSGPVFITDRGRPAHVLMTFEEYQRLTGSRPSIGDLLSVTPGAGDIDLEIPRSDDPARAADLR